MHALLCAASLLACACRANPREGAFGDGGVDLLIPVEYEQDGGLANGDGAVSGCELHTFALSATRPDVMIVLDRSGSMDDDALGQPTMTAKAPNSKWMQVVTAIKQATDSVSTINWGLWLFSSGASNCSVDFDPTVSLGATAASVQMALDSAYPAGGTPTTAAITQLTGYYNQLLDGVPHYALLATDGEPSCNPDPMASPSDSANAEAAVASAASQGVHTFVIGIGSTTAADATLTQMAINGMEPNPTPNQKPYYAASSTAEFITALHNVAFAIVSCEYPLAFVPIDPTLVTVQSSSGVIPYDPTHNSGWDFGAGNQSLIFYGAPCSSLKIGAFTSLNATYCPLVM